jgi:hypothetical protein
MNLNKNKTYIFIHIALALFVFLCFRAGIDNFFAGDDFDWLFETIKMTLQPSYFFEAQNYDLRPTEFLYFLFNIFLAGVNPVSYQLTAILIHVVNVVLVSLVISRICKNRLAGLIGSLFWGVNYKHVEAVFRPHATADSLALLFFLVAFLFLLNKQNILALVSFSFSLFAKENALVLPLVITLYVCWFVATEKTIWLKHTIPLWIATFVAVGLVEFVRSGDPAYLTIDWNAFPRFWELMMSYVGPDVVYLKQVWLGGKAYLLSGWLAGILFLILGVAFWKLPNVYRFGLLWMGVTTLPTLFIVYQTSRYYYVPLVGFGIIVGQGVSQLLTYLGKKNSQKAIVGICLTFTVIIVYLVIGVNLEEQDYAFYGEIHRQAAESFQQNILPHMPKDEQAMAVFLKQDSMKWAEALYARFLLKPWYLPGTYKWVYRRPYAMLGLSNTYGFVSWSTYRTVKDTLFVAIPYEEYRNRLLSGDFYIIMHDNETNTFRFGPDTLRPQIIERINDQKFYEFLQPGHFDPTNRGSLYF